MLITSEVTQIAAIIAQGGIVAYPTEAVFGLGCDPNNQAAVQRLLTLKQRPIEKGLIIIAANLAQLTDYILPLDAKLDAQLAKTWPGAVTWLLPASRATPCWITGQHSSIAVRVSAHDACQQLCQVYGKAIVSTSANPSECMPARSISAVQAYFNKGTNDRVDAIFDAPLGEYSQPTEIRDALTQQLIRCS
jgi:L-threonylcarbamoyladenylate synthase